MTREIFVEGVALEHSTIQRISLVMAAASLRQASFSKEMTSTACLPPLFPMGLNSQLGERPNLKQGFQHEV